VLSWPASAADLLNCEFLVNWRLIVRRKRNYQRPLTGSLRFGDDRSGIQIRHAG
jgi:hypothetical protein